LHPLAVLGVEASLPAVPARHVVNGVPNHLTPNGQTLSSAAGSHAGARCTVGRGSAPGADQHAATGELWTPRTLPTQVRPVRDFALVAGAN
jgi:hypothetical protein